MVRFGEAVRPHFERLACHPVDGDRVTVDVGDRPMDAIPLLSRSTGSCYLDSLGGDYQSKRQQHHFHGLDLGKYRCAVLEELLPWIEELREISGSHRANWKALMTDRAAFLPDPLGADVQLQITFGRPDLVSGLK